MSISAIKEKALRRFRLEKAGGFGDCFFYFVGLQDNPLSESVSQIMDSNVNASLKKDAEMVAEDFNKVFKSSIDVEAE